MVAKQLRLVGWSSQYQVESVVVCRETAVAIHFVAEYDLEGVGKARLKTCFYLFVNKGGKGAFVLTCLEERLISNLKLLCGPPVLDSDTGKKRSLNTQSSLSSFPPVTSHITWGPCLLRWKQGKTTVWVSGGASFRRIGDRVWCLRRFYGWFSISQQELDCLKGKLLRLRLLTWNDHSKSLAGNRLKMEMLENNRSWRGLHVPHVPFPMLDCHRAWRAQVGHAITKFHNCFL